MKLGLCPSHLLLHVCVICTCLCPLCPLPFAHTASYWVLTYPLPPAMTFAPIHTLPVHLHLYFCETW